VETARGPWDKDNLGTVQPSRWIHCFDPSWKERRISVCSVQDGEKQSFDAVLIDTLREEGDDCEERSASDLRDHALHPR